MSESGPSLKSSNPLPKILAFAGILVFFSFLGFWALKSDKPPAAPASEKSSPALTVDAATASFKLWPDVIKASGSIAPWQEALIGAEISGLRLIEVLADVGDVVTKGQVLAKFNPDTILAEQAELKAAYDQAEADSRRALKLRASGAMSAQQIDSFVHQAAIAKARLDAKALQLRYTEVTAPDNGVISQRSATLGAVGTTGQELFRLIRQNRLEWRGELTASQLVYIGLGQTVEIALPGDTIAHAIVRQIAPSLDTQSRMATVYADIKPGSAARAGMYGNAKIKRAGKKALVVPSKGIVIRDGNSYVFKILEQDDGSAAVRRQRVITGRVQDNQTEITEGLTEGETIAVKGAGFLNDGDIVKIVEQQNPDRNQTP